MGQPLDDGVPSSEAGQFLNAELPKPSGPSTMASAGAATNGGTPGGDDPGDLETGGGGGGAIHARDGGIGGTLDEEGGMVQKVLRQSAHPTVALFHMGFKAGAIGSYLGIGLFTKNFVIQFVVTVTLLAFDFWVVKNVTGRLLVGLRWWHEIDEDGLSQAWRFETVYDRENLNVTDSRIFWWTMYLCPVVWILLGIVCVLKMNVSYLIIVFIALVLSGANIVGYYKCNKDATEQIKNYIGKTMLGHAMNQSGLGRLSQYI